MNCAVTPEQLKTLLRYDLETGFFTWRASKGRAAAGSIAGSPDKNQHILITIDGKRYAAHRLAWLYVTGKWPAGEIDHREGRSNRWGNLRDVDHNINMQNLRAPMRRKNRSTPHLGVRRADNARNPWQATIRVDGKFRSLGSYATPEQAHAAYIDAKRQLHPGNTL